MDLSLILFKTPGRIYSISKESKHTTISINNETQLVPLLCLSSRFMLFITCVPFFILGKLSPE